MTRRPGIERALFIYAPLRFALLFLLAPFYWMLITALKPNSELYNAGGSPLRRAADPRALRVPVGEDALPHGQ